MAANAAGAKGAKMLNKFTCYLSIFIGNQIRITHFRTIL